MMSTKRMINFFIVLSIAFTCCEGAKNEHIIVRKEHYSDGRVKSAEELALDSIRDGKYIEYYNNGIIKTIATYNRGKIDGLFSGYYKNGALKFTIPYTIGQKKGLACWYYQTGNLEAECEFDFDVKIGKAYSYYDNGELKIFHYYHNGKLMYNRYYDADGNYVGEEGHAIANVSLNNDTIFFNDTFKIAFTLALPPDSEPQFYIGQMEDDLFLDKRQIELSQLNGDVINYFKVMDRKGNVRLGAILQLTAKKDSMIYVYDFHVDLLVE